ncbi:MAG: alpha-amylase [Rhodothermaceae bacterium]|nr:MAG: alpha-amylase [Rhodothermaceae bacterium]
MKPSLLLLALILGLAACRTEAPPPAADGAVPAWAADAVWYQIFPERFRNGDPSNDPVRASIEFPERAPENWHVMPWTADWYARADWERAMGDNFYDSVFHRRYGGDLQGVLDRLGYLDSLGVTALYFNPVFWARSLHKYDGNTYHHIDPYFGPDPEGDLALIATETSDPATWHWTAADSLFLRLVREVHARGMRLIIDGVFNHTGRDFFAFADLRKNQQNSPYRDWYIVKAFDDPATPEDEFDYEGWWGVKTLPVFADNAEGTDLAPGPKQYVFDATARWMDPNGDGDPSDGIDGWRLDVANEVPVGFWADWNAYVRRLNPEAFTVSEVWEEAGDFLREGGFSSTMNYHAFAIPVKGFLIDGTLPASEFAALLDARRAAFDPARRYAVQNLIDSHDTERVASMIVNAGRYDDYIKPEWFDYDRGERASPRGDAGYLVRKPNARERDLQRLIALFQMTYVGAPMLYYGTEAGMWGADDPDDRMPMVWPELAYAPQAADPLGRPRTPDPVAFDAELYDFYRAAIHLRRAHPSLCRGDFRVLATDDAAQMLAFARTLEDEMLVVVLNRSDAPGALDVPEALLRLGAGEGLAPVFATTGPPGKVSLTRDGAVARFEVPARTAVVFHRTGIE